VVRDNTNAKIKIGQAVDPFRRMKQLQAQNSSGDLEAVYFIPCYQPDLNLIESTVQQCCMHAWDHHEWFTDHDLDLLDLSDSVICGKMNTTRNRYGRPRVVASEPVTHLGRVTLSCITDRFKYKKY
jgi:hypothetical protein